MWFNLFVSISIIPGKKLLPRIGQALFSPDQTRVFARGGKNAQTGHPSRFYCKTYVFAASIYHRVLKHMTQTQTLSRKFPTFMLSKIEIEIANRNRRSKEPNRQSIIVTVGYVVHRCLSSFSNSQVIKVNPQQLMPHNKDTSDVRHMMTYLRSLGHRDLQKEEFTRRRIQTINEASTSICHRKWCSVVSFHCISSSFFYTFV